jgi:hypothetical protein
MTCLGAQLLGSRGQMANAKQLLLVSNIYLVILASPLPGACSNLAPTCLCAHNQYVSCFQPRIANNAPDGGGTASAILGACPDTSATGRSSRSRSMNQFYLGLTLSLSTGIATSGPGGRLKQGGKTGGSAHVRAEARLLRRRADRPPSRRERGGLTCRRSLVST